MFFKTNNPKAVNAVSDLFRRKSKLHAAAEKFSSAFDAKPIITQSINSIQFAGFVFNNPSNVNINVWTNPAHHRISRIRTKPVKKEFKTEWEVASAKYNELWNESFQDESSIKKDEVFESLGTDWGNVAFAGLGFFLHNDFVYVNTGLSKLDAIEILGSEYEEALADYKKGAVK